MSEYTWIGEGVFSVADFLSTDECQELIALSEAQGYADAPINTGFGAAMRKDIRNNDRVIIDELTERRRSGRKPAISCRPTGMSEVVGFNERLRFYRYTAGQQFDWHRDSPFTRDNGERSFITVLIYLNGGFVGGSTAFDEPDLLAGRPLKVVPQEGLALFFDHWLLHKGESVLDGCKYVVRTDVMYSSDRNPKGGG